MLWQNFVAHGYQIFKGAAHDPEHLVESGQVDGLHRRKIRCVVQPETKLVANCVIAAAGKQDGIEDAIGGIFQILLNAQPLLDAQFVACFVPMVCKIENKRRRRAEVAKSRDNVGVLGKRQR